MDGSVLPLNLQRMIMTIQHRIPIPALLPILPVCIAFSVFLGSCASGEETNEAPVATGHETVSDSILAYDPDTYEQIVKIYTMPAAMIEKGKRGSIKEHMYNNADKLSIDTTIVFDPATFELKRWQITATPKTE